MTDVQRVGPTDTEALEEAAEWLMALSAGSVTDAQRADWLAWRSSSPKRAQAWQRAERLMGKLDGLPPALSISALDRPADPGRRAMISRLALLLAVLPAGWAGWKLTEQQGWAADYRSSVGQCRQLTLADGTQIFLNTDSAIDIRFDGDERFIQLRRGEILVQTAPDIVVPARPLRVGTREGRMQALGTRFSVRERDGRTYLAVIEGAIRIEPARAAAPAGTVVQAGERVDFNAHTVGRPMPVDSTATAWTQGMLLADHMRLDEFVAELARYQRGVIRCDPRIAGLRISGAFPVSDTQRSLSMLESTYALRVSAHMHGYWTLLYPAEP
ncbi:MAG: FecR domain-containing protein [Candidatus Pseudomonas phytovorans]|uniref:FecR domain-containing protein n=1 Tax=Candidatus Pseudomonas phytovorans TaxID=3121377 RepID=A0AAJ6BAF1_9PSED|nr:FecR domain-containing protein [Pseudomonas sp.]WEK29107.1 MAG: FecR domain-containing protein [Pseudomonas sp.]